MLTKSEREEIAERFKEYIKDDETSKDCSDVYELLFGEDVPYDTDEEEDCNKISACILSLCDTSSMMELPRDKDGEVIRIGDTVYDKDDNLEYKVKGYLTRRNNIEIILDATKLTAYTTVSAEDLTHKKPVTIKSLAQRIKHVLEDEATSIGVNPYVELGRIADQLEKLGDSDD